MAYSSTTEAIEKLAAEIGDKVYIDVAKWHLYLQDAHLHTPLAEKLHPMLIEGEVEEVQVADVLASIPVKLGGGQRELPLSDLIPPAVKTDLLQILEDYRRQM
ncbi:MAG: DUF3181 family protein [Elainellaceae cyanobacterium]